MPEADKRPVRIPVHFLLAGAALVLALWFMRKALAPFFLAMVLSYVMAPAVAWLTRRMHRGRAVLVVLLGFLGALGALVWTLVPLFLTQAERLVNSFPAWRDGVMAKWMPWLQAHPRVEARVHALAESLDVVGMARDVGSAGMSLLGGAVHLLGLILVPLIIWYLLMDGARLLGALEDLVPPRHREAVRGVVLTIHGRLGGYIRGQIAVALVMSLLQGLAFQCLGLGYPWLLGIVAGVSNVVPYSPYLTALAPALVACGLAGASWSRLLLVAVVFTVVQKAETLYFTPVWVGRASHLHPLEVLLALMVFGFAFGMVGLVLAIPLMIVLKVLLEVVVRDYKAHPWYGAPR